ncbi:MAG: hypothetical protein HYY02_01875 [Chloroflexi bacterium]|nr:hypothetical protein [Chloroflexota bacterium]
MQTTEKLIRQFAILVETIPEVTAVFCELSDGGVCLTTILDSTPFDKQPRNRVYEAQLEILTVAAEPVLEFRLINLNEFDDDQRGTLIPYSAIPVYERSFKPNADETATLESGI